MTQNNSVAPTMPAPLDHTVFNTRQQVRDHQNAAQAYYDHLRNIERQALIAADLARAKEIAEANREMSDFEYDTAGLKRFNEAKDKQAALLAKEKQDALEKTAFMLSSPPIVNLNHRSEYGFLKDFEFWIGRGYSLAEDGLNFFQPGFYNVDLTATPKSKGVK